MNNFVSMLKSSLALKFIMAVTGVGLVLFVIGHLLGNLQIYQGREVFNHYAELLKSWEAARK